MMLLNIFMVPCKRTVVYDNRGIMNSKKKGLKFSGDMYIECLCWVCWVLSWFHIGSWF